MKIFRIVTLSTLLLLNTVYQLSVGGQPPNCKLGLTASSVIWQLTPSTSWINIILTVKLSEQCQEYLGCWGDSWNDRAIEGKRTTVSSVKECQERAVREGNTVFAVQDKKECFTHSNAENTYKNYGRSNRCLNGVGGPWSSDVYKIVLCPGRVS